jgi:hypothetical protein
VDTVRFVNGKDYENLLYVTDHQELQISLHRSICTLFGSRVALTDTIPSLKLPWWPGRRVTHAGAKRGSRGSNRADCALKQRRFHEEPPASAFMKARTWNLIGVALSAMDLAKQLLMCYTVVYRSKLRTQVYSVLPYLSHPIIVLQVFV